MYLRILDTGRGDTVPEVEEVGEVAYAGGQLEHEEVRGRQDGKHQLGEPGPGRREVIDMPVEGRGEDKYQQCRDPELAGPFPEQRKGHRAVYQYGRDDDTGRLPGP